MYPRNGTYHASRRFKKGDLGDCSNYRPISLICVGYKIFANILLDRLKKAGAEERIWKTQFGFKGHRGTVDALLLARRTLEQAFERKDRRILMLGLDWAKAFDIVAPDRLIACLRRFGLPNYFVEVIAVIYRDCRFFVRSSGRDST